MHTMHTIVYFMFPDVAPSEKEHNPNPKIYSFEFG